MKFTCHQKSRCSFHGMLLREAALWLSNTKHTSTESKNSSQLCLALNQAHKSNKAVH